MDARLIDGFLFVPHRLQSRVHVGEDRERLIRAHPLLGMSATAVGESLGRHRGDDEILGVSDGVGSSGDEFRGTRRGGCFDQRGAVVAVLVDATEVVLVDPPRAESVDAPGGEGHRQFIDRRPDETTMDLGIFGIGTGAEGTDRLIVIIVENKEDPGHRTGAHDEVGIPAAAFGQCLRRALPVEVDAHRRRTGLGPVVLRADDDGDEAAPRGVPESVRDDPDDVLGCAGRCLHCVLLDRIGTDRLRRSLWLRWGPLLQRTRCLGPTSTDPARVPPGLDRRLWTDRFRPQRRGERVTAVVPTRIQPNCLSRLTGIQVRGGEETDLHSPWFSSGRHLNG